jgi:hypothetical protein
MSIKGKDKKMKRRGLTCPVAGLVLARNRQHLLGENDMNARMKHVMLGAVVVILLIMRMGHAGLSEGLVGYWSFDNTGDLGHDDSGNGNDGIIVGPTSTIGQVGTALSFDGIDDIIEIAERPCWDFASSDFSVSFWLKYPDVRQWESLIGNEIRDHFIEFSGWGVWIKEGGYIVFEANGNPVGPPSDPLYDEIRTDADALTIGSWHHVVISREGTGIGNSRIYVDGMLMKADTLDAFVDNDYPLRIGRAYEQYFSDFYFSGLMDEVRIYERALTIEEVAVLADPTPPEPVEAVEDLVLLVIIVNDDNEIMNSTLEAKLNGALNTLADINESNNVAAINTLGNFIDAVIRQRDRGDIPSLDAQDLIDAAQYTINLLTSTKHD